MDSALYYYWIIVITSVYFALLMSRDRYRLLLPSVVHTAIWLITAFLVLCQLKGWFVTHTLNDNAVNLVSRLTCYLVVASVIGFSFAHFVSETQNVDFSENPMIEQDEVEELLRRFKWIPYTCGITGAVLFIFLITTIGDISTFSDYRILALQTERVGYAAVAQRISGHINILGSFYLMLLGYKSGKQGINVREFLSYFLLCSAINMSIGGRVWLLSSSLPFFATYVLSRYTGEYNRGEVKKDGKRIAFFLITVISLFSVIGLLRGNDSDDRFIDKFLYLTDGTRMTNMVLNRFPEGTFTYEYGMSTILGGFVKSPMVNAFKESISDNIGLSVTVKSIMPSIYYDFGLIGGGIWYGFLCFVVELICLRLKYATSILGLFLFGVLSTIYFQAPVGNVFALYTPTFEWLILLYLFRKHIFRIT